MKKVMDFFGCMLQGDCIYSIKKFLAYITFILICYIAIFTTKDYTELLIFLGALLAIRSYDKITYNNKENNEKNNI